MFSKVFISNKKLDKMKGRCEMDDLQNWSPPPKKKASNSGAFLAGIIGVVIGALLVWILTPGQPSTKGTSEQGQNQIINEERVNFDIHTELTDVVEQSTNSVVGVTNLQTVNDFWSSSESTEETGTGSGVIYKKENGKAYIVSNHHVVENAQALEITFDDGTKAEGKLIGSDIWTDLAVIEIDAKDVDSVAKFGDSDLLKRGESVIAIGNPLGLGFSGSVTVGVVSGKDRSIPIDLDNDGRVDWYADVLQTDAAINPGNSGGALINLAGELIGINSMKISQETIEGIGLAIPINLAAPIIEKLEKDGEVIRPSMGVTLIDLASIPSQQQFVLKLPQEVTEGVVVNDVLEGSAAEKAGMQRYDVIVEMDGKNIDHMIALRKHLYNEKEVGEEMSINVYREGKAVTLKMILDDGTSF